ncbi:hypothetical protein SASPL_156502 [Salvia splendens]|uniref:Uncharacterized protein n=1 Tax=Salvia splendens TaxID=180675 RepID=A0A8X8VWL0_SALSN|nr:hypothetical protein SASPL_156502 [Salvia splendens]
MMLDFLRDKESGERIRLDNLLADFVEIAADLIQRKNIGIYLTNIYHAIGKLRKTRKRIMEFGAGEGLIRTQSVEGGDELGVMVGLEKDVQQLIGRVIQASYTSTKEVLVKLVQQLLEHDGDGDSLVVEEMDNQNMDFESFSIDLASSGTFVYISYLKLIMHD